MKLFKDTDNKIWAYNADGSQDHLIGQKTPVTQHQADQLIARQQQAQFDALSYAEKRKAEYPNMLDYIDGVVKGDQEQIDTYITACLAVKAKYPKPSGV